jgi:hypothetical protein
MIKLTDEERESLQADILRAIAKSHGFVLTGDDQEILADSKNPRIKKWQYLTDDIMTLIDEM